MIKSCVPGARGRWLTLAGLLCCGSAAAGPTAHIQVRGTTTLELNARHSEGVLTVRGRLKDDGGRGLAERRLSLELARVPGESSGAATCDEASPPRLVKDYDRAKDTLFLETARDGRFCVTVPGAILTGSLRASYTDPTGLLEGTEAEAEIIAARRSLELGFIPPPRRIDLSERIHTVFVRLDAAKQPDELVDVSLELLIHEAHQPPRRIETISATVGETVPVELEATSLGGPGAATLIVQSRDSEDFHPASASAVLERVLPVTLSVADQSENEDRVQVGVASSRGAVDVGSVEARIQGRTVAIAPVRAGAANLPIKPTSADGGKVAVSLAYVPDSPWWLPGRPIEILVATQKPFNWGAVLWSSSLLALLAWIAAAYRRPTARSQTEGKSRSRPTGRPGVALVRPLPEKGWRGRVVDAHEGQPLGQCRIEIQPPHFDRPRPATVTMSDEAGEFCLEPPAEPLPEGTQLRVSRASYSSLTGPMPAQGSVLVSLVTHRRAALDRLVGWVKQREGPYRRLVDPTPAQVSDVAGKHREADVADWATRIEAVAYAAVSPNEEDEQSIAAQERSLPARPDD